MRNNHRGFTLAELLVVVAILGVLVGISALSISTASSAQAKKCASSLDALLSETKMAALSRSGKNYLALYVDGTEGLCADLYQNETLRDHNVLGSRIAVTYEAGGVTASLGSSPLYIAFDRETGAFLSLQAAAALAGAAAPDRELQRIVLTRGRSYEIVIASMTGYHELGG